jgi:hypothetical protein
VTLIYRPSQHIALEGFDDGALALRLTDQSLFELNPLAQFILTQTDGRRPVSEVVLRVADAYAIDVDEALQDVTELYAQLLSDRLVEIYGPISYRRKEQIMDDQRYVRNPDVGMREEDEDGALLFNPDTNQVQVINPTGLFIWNLCDGSRSLNAIAEAMQQEFEGAPADEMEKDLKEFIDVMVAVGFIGTVEAMNA